MPSSLKRHLGKVNVSVPHYVMSGWTLIALAADEIVMDPDAVLGPVDPQLGQSAAASIMTVLERKNMNDIDDQPRILADVAHKALVQVQATVRDLLAERMPGDQAAALAKKLASGTWTHDYAITSEAARSLGLPISTDMPPEVSISCACSRSPPGRDRRSNTCRCPTAATRPAPAPDPRPGRSNDARAPARLIRAINARPHRSSLDVDHGFGAVSMQEIQVDAPHRDDLVPAGPGHGRWVPRRGR